VPTSDDNFLLLDTSAALAYLDPDHTHHAAVRAVTGSALLGLAGHAHFETFSVLTRLPVGKRQSAADAARLIAVELPESRFLPQQVQAGLLATFSDAGIVGGAIYDALVAAAAHHHGATLITCDIRARGTYQALGVHHRLVDIQG
jgi:predicted nucleic acid-binding protein